MLKYSTLYLKNLKTKKVLRLLFVCAVEQKSKCRQKSYAED